MGKGQYPKIDGEIQYALDSNINYSNSQDFLRLVQAIDYMTSGQWGGSLHTGFKNCYFDSLIGSNHISGNSTGSYYYNNIGYSFYTNSTYVCGSPANSSFETAINGTDWTSGATDGTGDYAVSTETTWDFKTGDKSLYIVGSNSGAPATGSLFIVSKLIDFSNLAGLKTDFGITAANHQATYNLRFRISGPTINKSLFDSFLDSGTFLNQSFEIGSPIGASAGSGVILIDINYTNYGCLSAYIDNIRYIRYNSGNLLPDQLITTGLSAESGKTFKTAFFQMNGSLTGCTGSYLLSADGGTNWEGVNNGSAIEFTNAGNMLNAKIQMFSSGGYPFRIYNFGITTTQS